MTTAGVIDGIFPPNHYEISGNTMATFEDQFKEHAVHSTLSQLEAAITQEHDHALDEAAIDYLDHLRQGVAFIRSRLEVASPAHLANIDEPGFRTGSQRWHRFLVGCARAPSLEAPGSHRSSAPALSASGRCTTAPWRSLNSSMQ